MSKNRYGRIYHSNHNHINLRFPSADARDEFAVKFQKYHEGHDHEGEAPRFEDITAQQAGNTVESSKLHNVQGVTIDGYATYEIEEYHEDDKMTRYYRYKPPTCCVAPLISIKRKLVESDTLQRHELSAIFGDMPDEDYQSMLESVSNDGFIDNVVRLYEGQILDGYHRYRAAKELNLLRKLRFKQWHEDEHRDGDPRVFVYGRNQHRRHYSAAQRAQVAVAFNERFGHGGDRKSDESKHQNGVLKTKKELAKEANVGTSTIDRAVQVEKEGKSEAVISGETTTGEVIKERDLKKAVKRKKQVLKNIWDTWIRAGRDYGNGNHTELNQYLSLPELEKGFAENNTYCADIFQSGMKRIDEARSFADLQERALGVDESGNANTDTQDLESELRAIQTYAGDIRNWKRPDWSPDTNWILPLIEAKKAKASSSKVTAEEAKQMEKDYPGVEVLNTKDAEQEFAEDQQRAKQAERQMWDALESVAPDWAKDDFAAAACDRMNWGVTEFPDPLETDQPAIWRPRFELLRKEIELPADWIQQMLTKMAEPEPEENLPLQESLDEMKEDADDAKALLEAQERADTSRKRMWSQVSSEIRTKGGKTLQDLSNEDIAKAAATSLGLSRIEVPKDGIAFEAYEFIMGDIESPPYSLSDCPLSDARTWTARFYKIYDDIENRAEWVSELLADVKTLQEQIEKNVRAIRDAYTEVYKKGAASVLAMFTAGITYYNLPKEGLKLSLDNPTGGYTDETRLTRIEGVTAQMLRDFEGRVKAVWIRKSLSNDVDAEKLPLQNALEEETVESLWEKITPAISVWKAARKDKGVGRASKTMFLSATKCFHGLPKDAETDVDLLQKLLAFVTELHGPGYTFERYIKMQVDGASIWEETEPAEETSDGRASAGFQPADGNGLAHRQRNEQDRRPSADEPDEDTSLAEIDNLPAVKHFLEMLSKQVETFIPQTDRDDLSLAVFDVFVEQFENVSEREQLTILIDVAHNIVSESESL